jgi:hypothetical protein
MTEKINFASPQRGSARMRRQKELLGTKEGRLAVAEAIRQFLNAAGQTRKVLVGQERHKLSESTVNKVFQGEFSERTLTMIEAILATKFRTTEEKAERAPDDVGGYTFQSVVSLLGDYVCVRPLFEEPTSLAAYVINIRWDKQTRQLMFEERQRPNPKYTHNGVIYIPQNRPFMFLVSLYPGSVRLITLSVPEADGLARGIISTVSNPKGPIFIPVAAPIFLRRIEPKVAPQLGIITAKDPCYSEYQDTLASITSEDFGLFLVSQNATERHRAVSLVNS